jgi:hypothetical protein
MTYFKYSLRGLIFFTTTGPFSSIAFLNDGPSLSLDYNSKKKCN